MEMLGEMLETLLAALSARCKQLSLQLCVCLFQGCHFLTIILLCLGSWHALRLKTGPTMSSCTRDCPGS